LRAKIIATKKELQRKEHLLNHPIAVTVLGGLIKSHTLKAFLVAVSFSLRHFFSRQHLESIREYHAETRSILLPFLSFHLFYTAAHFSCPGSALAVLHQHARRARLS
jgi:hypothetical protein